MTPLLFIVLCMAAMLSIPALLGRRSDLRAQRIADARAEWEIKWCESQARELSQ